MMVALKPLTEQVVVITGASSGIGLVTAKQAAQRGASVVLAARNEKDLHDATEAIRRTGGRAAFTVADVADATQVEAIGDTAIREFGRIDTWVNNAAVSMYGRITELRPIARFQASYPANLSCLAERNRLVECLQNPDKPGTKGWLGVRDDFRTWLIQNIA